MSAATYNKIIVIGNCGSGKSYLSKKLSDITGLPLIHLDNEFWKPNWIETDKDEWLKKQYQFTKKDKWIIDGNYNGTMELRFSAADLIIFLDIRPIVCTISAIKRHGKKRSDLPDYLEEKFDYEFFEFCKLIWKFNKTGKMTILKMHEKYPDKKFLVIKNRRVLNKLLQRWENEKGINLSL